MATQVDDNVKRREAQFHSSMANEVLKGNFGTVQQALRQKIRENKDYDPTNAVRAIATSAEELTFPRDLRREGHVQQLIHEQGCFQHLIFLPVSRQKLIAFNFVVRLNRDLAYR